MNEYDIKKSLTLQKYNTEITREQFERFFKKTAEKVVFTYNGWDGKSISYINYKGNKHNGGH